MEDLQKIICALSDYEFDELIKYRKTNKNIELIKIQVAEKGLSLSNEKIQLEGITCTNFDLQIEIHANDRITFFNCIKDDYKIYPLLDKFDFIDDDNIEVFCKNEEYEITTDWDFTVFEDYGRAYGVISLYAYYIPYSEENKIGMGWNIDLNKLIYFVENKIYVLEGYDDTMNVIQRDESSCCGQLQKIVIEDKNFILNPNLSMDNMVLKNIIPYR